MHVNQCDKFFLFQTLKQNTEPEGEDCAEESKSKESVGTQTPGKCVRPPKPYLGSHSKVIDFVDCISYQHF